VIEASVFWFSRLNLHVLLGFQRLMQAFRIAEALHHAAVNSSMMMTHRRGRCSPCPLEQRMPQRLIDVVDDRDVLDS